MQDFFHPQYHIPVVSYCTVWFPLQLSLLVAQNPHERIWISSNIYLFKPTAIGRLTVFWPIYSYLNPIKPAHIHLFKSPWNPHEKSPLTHHEIPMKSPLEPPWNPHGIDWWNPPGFSVESEARVSTQRSVRLWSQNPVDGGDSGDGRCRKYSLKLFW